MASTDVVGRAASVEDWEWARAVLVSPVERAGWLTLLAVWLRRKMFATAQKTQELWMWKMEYLHHEQRPLYFGEWF